MGRLRPKANLVSVRCTRWKVPSLRLESALTRNIVSLVAIPLLLTVIVLVALSLNPPAPVQPPLPKPTSMAGNDSCYPFRKFAEENNGIWPKDVQVDVENGHSPVYGISLELCGY
jgi:hypothetical protein